MGDGTNGGLTNLRWPGGVDIEHYELVASSNGVDLNKIDGSSGALSMAGLLMFLDFCADNHFEATIIIRSKWLQVISQGSSLAADKLAAQVLIEGFVEQILDYSEDAGTDENRATITGFEVGNEYPDLASWEYANILELVVPAVHDAILDPAASYTDANEIGIIAQIDGYSTRDAKRNNSIEKRSTNVFDKLDDGIAGKITGVTTHFYTDAPNEDRNVTYGDIDSHVERRSDRQKGR